MHRRAWFLPFILAGLISLVACQAGQPVASQVSPPAATAAISTGDATAIPAETPAAQTAPVATNSGANGFQELLSYVSPQWLERHTGDVLGAGIQLVDVAQVRKDLSIPPITGASSSKEKANLILSLSNQSFGVTSLGIKLPASYQQWGWDIADVDQALTFLDDHTSIAQGKFDSALIKDRLETQGYQASPYGDFTLFLKANKPTKHDPQLAVKDDTVIIGWDEAPVRSLIDRKASRKPGLDQSDAMQKILPHLAGTWGVYLAPRGTLDNYARWLKLQSMMARDESFYQSWLGARLKQTGQIAWDVLAISWQGKQPINLQFLYLYPTQAEAQKDSDLVKESLTTAPSFNRSEPWSKVLNLGQVASDGALLIATATTNSDSLIGNALVNREWALFPIRNVSAATNTTSIPNSSAGIGIETTQLDSGWIRYSQETDGFSLALPPEWLQIDMNPATIDAVLNKVVNDNPDLKSMLTDQIRNAVASGFKFYSIDMPKNLTSREIAQMIVIRSSEWTDLPLETLGRTLLNQYDSYTAVVKPVKLERIHLPAGEARRFTFKQNLPDGTGKTLEVETTQYLLIDGSGYPYVLSFSAFDDQSQAYAPVFEKIAQSFQFVK